MDEMITQAAVELAKSLGPPQAHAIYIRTVIDEDTGEKFHTIMCAVNPAFKGKIRVPPEFRGQRVKEFAWPDPKDILGTAI